MACFRDGDEPEIIFRDLIEAVPVGGPGSEDEFSAYDFFEKLMPAINDICKEQLRTDAAYRGLASLTSVNYNCDVRMVVSNPFRSIRDKVDIYEPQAAEWLPMGIVNLRTNQDDNLSFQLDLNRLNHFIDTLNAMKKDLEVAYNIMKDAGFPSHRQAGLDEEFSST